MKTKSKKEKKLKILAAGDFHGDSDVSKRLAKKAEKEDPTLTLENSVASTFARAPYMYGAWAIQYLKQEKGMDVFLNEFYPAIRELGW